MILRKGLVEDSEEVEVPEEVAEEWVDLVLVLGENVSARIQNVAILCHIKQESLVIL